MTISVLVLRCISSITKKIQYSTLFTVFLDNPSLSLIILIYLTYNLNRIINYTVNIQINIQRQTPIAQQYGDRFITTSGNISHPLTDPPAAALANVPQIRHPVHPLGPVLVIHAARPTLWRIRSEVSLSPKEQSAACGTCAG